MQRKPRKEVVNGKKARLLMKWKRQSKKTTLRLHARRQMLKVLYPVTETSDVKKRKNTKKVDMVENYSTI